MIELLLASQLATVNNVLISTYAVSAATDISITEYALGKNIAHEANPVQKLFTDKGPVWAGVAKGSMHTGIGYLLLKYKKDHDRKVLFAVSMLTAAQILIDVNNARAISEAKH